MKLAFVFLVCFVGITWQQEVFVRQSPQDFYYTVNNYARQYPVNYQQAFQQAAYQQYAQQQLAQQQYYEPSNENPYVYHQSNPGVEVAPHPTDAALLYGQLNGPASFARQNNRPFLQFLSNIFGGGIFGGGGLFGGNNANQNNNRRQRTTTVTSVSVVTAEAISYCLARTMFAATTACRRRRSILDIISLDDIHADEAPTPSEPLNSAIVELPREGRDVDAADNIQSSKQDEYVDEPYYYSNPSDALAQEFLRQGRPVVTVTSYSFSVTTIVKTRTNSKLAASGALSCLPAGQVLC